MSAAYSFTVKAWEDKIVEEMNTKRTSSVEFVSGRDFKAADLSWIKERLIPYLRSDWGANATLRTRCRWHGRQCEHADETILTVSLK